MCTRGKLQRDVGHVRIRVVIVTRQIHNKPCSARIQLTVRSDDRDVGVGGEVGGDVELITCVCLV